MKGEHRSTEQQGSSAAAAAPQLATLPAERKSEALAAISDALRREVPRIEGANRIDMEQAERDQVAAPLVKRLRFDRTKVEELVLALNDIAALPDPVGRVRSARELDSGLTLYQVSCPVGVIGMIFESRPDALVQIAALALKSGNSVMLKGGSEARSTNRVLYEVIRESTEGAGVPGGWIQLLETRMQAAEMLGLDRYIDLIIPRGSNEFVAQVMRSTNIPVLGHADGVCHLYLDRDADTEMAAAIAVDAKTQYVAVCNAIETLLVHRAAAERLLPAVAARLQEAGVELRGCARTRELLPDVNAASDEDWGAEYLDYILAVKVVDSLDDAVAHIKAYGSGHTDAIVSENRTAAERFMGAVDSASIMWNCSTRFADGYRYGLGAEVGISTSKIHARGPVGLEGLMSYNWRLYGNGQVVASYAGPNAKRFTHRELPPQIR